MSYRLGFDIGGTFTDLTLVDETSGAVYQEKVPTTEPDFSRGGLEGIRKICRENGVDIGELAYVSHGTTVATNALLERTGARTGLLTTAGFEDILAIGREKREETYDLSPSKTPTFTERTHRYGVTERVTADGDVLESIDPEEIERIAKTLESDGVESVGVSLIHSYRFPDHEHEIAEIVRGTTDMSVSLSTQVMNEINEYERTLATVINAYVNPIVTSYIERLTDGLSELGIEHSLHLMQANGGVMTPDKIDGRQLQLINSGPAAGVLGAKQLASASGVDDVITLDMGGTSTDTSVVHNGEIATTTEGEIDALPLRYPQIDVRTIGTGGGSIAWIDHTGSLKVGPRSAGAQPGPACYGRGGTKPTVTDAALVLNYLDPNHFLGGEMDLDRAAAEDVISDLAERLDLKPVELANGILEIVATDMVGGIRLVTVEKGHDPREFALACFGGAGPMFADRLARKMGIETAIVPAACGVLSALGLTSADQRFDFSVSRPLVVEPARLEEINEIYSDLERRAQEIATDASFSRSVGVRYLGQTFNLEVTVPGGDLDEDDLDRIRSRFERQYVSVYGEANDEADIEAVTWRLDAVSELSPVRPALASNRSDVEDALKSTRDAYVNGEYREHGVYDRYALPGGERVEGPAIVEEDESTTVIGPDSTLEIDSVGNLVISTGCGE